MSFLESARICESQTRASTWTVSLVCERLLTPESMFVWHKCERVVQYEREKWKEQKYES